MDLKDLKHPRVRQGERLSLAQLHTACFLATELKASRMCTVMSQYDSVNA